MARLAELPANIDELIGARLSRSQRAQLADALAAYAGVLLKKESARGARRRVDHLEKVDKAAKQLARLLRAEEFRATLHDALYGRGTGELRSLYRKDHLAKTDPLTLAAQSQARMVGRMKNAWRGDGQAWAVELADQVSRIAFAAREAIEAERAAGVAKIGTPSLDDRAHLIETALRIYGDASGTILPQSGRTDASVLLIHELLKAAGTPLTREGVSTAIGRARRGVHNTPRRRGK